MSKPTICHVLVSPDTAEAGVLAGQLARLLRAEYHFTIVCLGEPSHTIEGLEDTGATIHPVRWTTGLDWDCSRRLERLLRRDHVDLLHAHQLDAFLHGMLARLFYRRPSVLFTAHHEQQTAVNSIERALVNRMLLEGRDQVVASSRVVRRALITKERLPAKRVGVIYNGIAPPALPSNLTETPSSIREEIGVENHAFLILHRALSDPSRNRALSLRAFERVRNDHPSAQLALAEPSADLGPLQDELRERGWNSRSIVLGPSVNADRVLAVADALLLTGVSEGLPAILLRALALGKPVIATRGGGVAEILEDRVSGLLVRAHDENDLAHGMLLLAASPELRARLGERGRQRIETFYEHANTLLLYTRKYRSMLGQ